MTTRMSRWERKSSSEYPENRFKDTFQCHNCNKYYLWYGFNMGLRIVLPESIDDSGDFFRRTDQEMRGYRWACNNCIVDHLEKEELIKVNVI